MDDSHPQFYLHALTNLPSNKPNHIFEGETLLYYGQIKVQSLKLSRECISEKELKTLKWDEQNLGKIWFKFRHFYPDSWAKMHTWQEFIRTFEDSLLQVFVNIAYPGVTLTHHYGVNKHYYRAHVCFQSNPGLLFDIEGEQRQWEEGFENSFSFDDGNLLHGIVNQPTNVDQPRIVCILDILK